jgi:hypothetical protein
MKCGSHVQEINMLERIICPYKFIQAFFTFLKLNQTLYVGQCIHLKKSSLPHELS